MKINVSWSSPANIWVLIRSKLATARRQLSSLSPFLLYRASTESSSGKSYSIFTISYICIDKY